ncbi:MAG: PHP domain-containing protein [Bacillota bacterium]
MAPGEGSLFRFTADLHVHTALSPCAEAEMTPLNIVGLCLENEVDIIAVTDHNSGENVRAVTEFAAGSGVTVWPGMEVQTREEVHLVTLFDNLAALEDWQEHVYARLPDRPNRPELFGEQLLFDGTGAVVGACPRLLLTSVDLSVSDVRREAERRGFVCYPAHIDRPAYSYLANLGFLPPSEEFAVLEISSITSPAEVVRKLPQLRGRTLVASSDAHRLAELGRAGTVLRLAAPTLSEFRKAIAGRGGRRVSLLSESGGM